MGKRKKRKTFQECYDEVFSLLKTCGRWKANNVCYDCKNTVRASFPIDKCPKCGSNNMVYTGPRARVPKKNASHSKWNKFWTNICDYGKHQLKNILQEKELQNEQRRKCKEC